MFMQPILSLSRAHSFPSGDPTVIGGECPWHRAAGVWGNAEADHFRRHKQKEWAWPYLSLRSYGSKMEHSQTLGMWRGSTEDGEEVLGVVICIPGCRVHNCHFLYLPCSTSTPALNISDLVGSPGYAGVSRKAFSRLFTSVPTKNAVTKCFMVFLQLCTSMECMFCQLVCCIRLGCKFGLCHVLQNNYDLFIRDRQYFLCTI